jgi:type I restriction enzyme S subunit
LILEVKENISVDYVYQKLLSYNLNKLVFGSGQPLITGGQLKNLKLFFSTSLLEQQKIASFLSLIDDRISTQIKIIEGLESLIKALNNKLLGIGTDNIPCIRFPEFSEKWEMKLGGKIFKKHSNKQHNSDLPIVAVTQNKGVAKREDIDYNITVEDKSIQSYKIIEKGDFVISLRSFEGGIEYSEITGICSPAYTILKSQLPIVDNFYRVYLKKSSYIAQLNERLEGIRDGKNISFDNFSIIPLPYPTISEQKKIAAFFTILNDSIETERNMLKKFIIQKRYLLGNLFI